MKQLQLAMPRFMAWLITLGLILALVVAPAASVGATHPEGSLRWQDDFIGNRYDPPSSTYWTYETGANVRNNELQCYTSSIENARLWGDNPPNGTGTLQIRALHHPNGYTCQNPNGPPTTTSYSSASLHSKDYPRYGRISIRAAMPTGTGVFPALWMLRQDWPSTPWPRSGEIDIVENPGQLAAVSGDEQYVRWYNLHGARSSNGTHWDLTQLTDPLQKINYYNTASSITSYHIYDLHWQPEKIEWYYDGVLKRTVNKSDLPTDWIWPFNETDGSGQGLGFRVIMNLAVGGNWPDDNIDPATFPKVMLVDWVKVYNCAC